MLGRSTVSRGAQRVLRRHCCPQPVHRRGLAAPASGSFQYQTGDSAGVKLASRDLAGPTTTLALVAKAGTRYQPLPGLTEALEQFAFKSNASKSTVRIVRESELLGSELLAYHSRENLVIGAKFLREDLPYFVELLSEVAGKTKYTPHAYHEDIEPIMAMAHSKYLASTNELAINAVHGLAFHRGLGNALKPSTTTSYYKYLSAAQVEEYASGAYSKSNIAIVANGADQADLSKWVNEFFSSYPNTSAGTLQSTQSKYFGGEERIAHGAGNTIALAFPGSSSFTGGFYKPEISVLASLLGGQSNIKWSPGFSLLSKASSQFPGATIDTKSVIYSDAGLLLVTINGAANNVAAAAQETVKTIKAVADGQISAEDIKKAKAAAKFKELEYGQKLTSAIELTGAGLINGGKAYQLDETAKAIDAVTDAQVKTTAKTLLEGKASVSAVGDLVVLPYAEELGLSV